MKYHDMQDRHLQHPESEYREQNSNPIQEADTASSMVLVAVACFCIGVFLLYLGSRANAFGWRAISGIFGLSFLAMGIFEASSARRR